jgi:hypothetical protein
MDLIGADTWEHYKSIIRDAKDTFDQAIITWIRSKGGLDYHGEDNATERFDEIGINGLMIFNSFRTWPITRFTETGATDQENVVLQLNRRYLDELGYLTADGDFAFNPTADRFKYLGKVYKAAGDTPISQAPDDPLHFYIILQREETDTGS